MTMKSYTDVADWHLADIPKSPSGSEGRAHETPRIFHACVDRVISQPVWCAASVARGAPLRLVSGLPNILHPFSDVAGPPDRPGCHTNFARHPLKGTHTPSLLPLDPVPLRSGTGYGQLRPEPGDPPTFHLRAANKY